ncbi:MAG: hypothetical protein JW941_12165 [Candidatus Coatesbacteria bacterium]|nr:hypothetical protein [Candidatus Coatesbacteria bacterium]
MAALEIHQIPGQAQLGTVEVHGVAAGDFDPRLWQKGTLNFVPDVRSPIIEPRKSGVFRNIYAPSAVQTEDGWRLFYGAWDGVPTGNDRIYSVTTHDFIDFDNHQIVIEHGDFIHCCNVNANRLPNGEWQLVCTVYPDSRGKNKPAVFTSPDGRYWNGRKAPYPAKHEDIISMEGYDKYLDADINGMNVLLPENDAFRLYFNNFHDFGRVYRATSNDGKHFSFERPVLEIGAVVNDVKKLRVKGQGIYYLMGLHMNTQRLWYSLSLDGMHFQPARELAANLGDADKYIVAIGWVVHDERVLGFIYGAGEVPELNRNRLFARWLQKKVVLIAEDGTRYEGTAALGPDRQIIKVPRDRQIKGTLTVYAEDGSTELMKCDGTLTSGSVHKLSSR